jgi:hypothetical protein
MFLVIKVKGGTEIYINGYLNNMKRETIIFDGSWGVRSFCNYDMIGFIEIFKNKDISYFGNLHRWLFE